jgi:hypothetical protein
VPDADLSRFDRDPDAVAWARAKVEKVRDQFREFEGRCAQKGDYDSAAMWRKMANMLELKLIGGKTCVITAFDERLPAWADSLIEALGGVADG